jgi:hypothetical protein
MTLRCTNEENSERKGEESEDTNRRDWHTLGYDTLRTRIYSGRSSRCATDLVGECRRCGIIICRNCAAKPPSQNILRNSSRLRRLCNACIKAPLSNITGAHLMAEGCTPAFTHSAFIREPCCCPEFFFICKPCARSIATNDTDYRRIWTWRSRYSTYLGGLGTGIGEGYEGVKCGRGTQCLTAHNIEVELDCEASYEIIQPRESDSRPLSRQSGSDSSDGDKAGYFRQEVEGVGGGLWGKVKKRIKVGQTVEEYDDERETGDYLKREASGTCRSWCSWCNRVVLGQNDAKVNS